MRRYESEEWVAFVTEDKLQNEDVKHLGKLTELCGLAFDEHVGESDISGFNDSYEHVTYLVYQEWSNAAVGFWSHALDFYEPTKSVLESFGKRVHSGKLSKEIYKLLIEVDWQITDALCNEAL